MRKTVIASALIAASVLPAMMLVHVSYRAHVTRNTKPVVAAVA